MLPDSTLMTMFSQAIAWQNYADTIATEAEIHEAEIALALDTAESEAVIHAWNSAATTVGPRGGVRSEFTATVAKAQRDTAPDVQSLRDAHLRARAARKRAQTVRDNSERIGHLLSRELSRRIGRDPVEKRAIRYLS